MKKVVSGFGKVGTNMYLYYIMQNGKDMNAENTIKDRILIGGKAVQYYGSSRSTEDTDYMVYNDGELFQTGEVDLINAAAHSFYGEIWEQEKGNDIASPWALVEMKAFSLVQHCKNMNFQKADDAEYDIRFLVRKFGVKPSVVKKYVGAGEYSEIAKIVNSVK